MARAGDVFFLCPPRTFPLWEHILLCLLRTSLRLAWDPPQWPHFNSIISVKAPPANEVTLRGNLEGVRDAAHGF